MLSCCLFQFGFVEFVFVSGELGVVDVLVDVSLLDLLVQLLSIGTLGYQLGTQRFLLLTFKRVRLILNAKLLSLPLEFNLLLCDFLIDLVLHKPMLETLPLLGASLLFIDFPLLLLLQDLVELLPRLVLCESLSIFQHQEWIIDPRVVFVIAKEDLLTLVSDFLLLFKNHLVTLLIDCCHLRQQVVRKFVLFKFEIFNLLL